MRRYATEFIGTFFLVFTVCTAVRSGAALAPLAIGAVLATMVFAGGHISGGHYNPAVSLAAFIRGKLGLTDLGAYAVAQFAAAVVAALLAVYAVPGHVSQFKLSSDDVLRAFLVELLFTFALAYVVLNVATSKDHPNNSFYGLAIGFTVLAGAVAVGGVSGGAFNPAVGLGALVAGLAGANVLWIYIVATLAGGALAGLVFRLLNPDDTAPIQVPAPRGKQPAGVSAVGSQSSRQGR